MAKSLSVNLGFLDSVVLNLERRIIAFVLLVLCFILTADYELHVNILHKVITHKFSTKLRSVCIYDPKSVRTYIPSSIF